jgi:hypothetical protein
MRYRVGAATTTSPIGAQRRRVEDARTVETVLLADREDQLHADRRALDRCAMGERQQHRHRGLVVGAEDRVARALPAAIDEHGLDDALVGHGVQVRAEHHRAFAAARDAREQVAAVRARLGGCVVLGDLVAERA